MTKVMGFVALCKYPDHDQFAYYSSEFYVNDWSEVEKVGQEIVDREWIKISPHPAPLIVKFIPGGLHYIDVDNA